MGKARSAFRFLFRVTTIWLVDAVSLSLTAWFLPGMGLGGHAGRPAWLVALGAALLLGACGTVRETAQVRDDVYDIPDRSVVASAHGGGSTSDAGTAQAPANEDYYNEQDASQYAQGSYYDRTYNDPYWSRNRFGFGYGGGYGGMYGGSSFGYGYNPYWNNSWQSGYGYYSPWNGGMYDPWYGGGWSVTYSYGNPWYGGYNDGNPWCGGYGYGMGGYYYPYDG